MSTPNEAPLIQVANHLEQVLARPGEHDSRAWLDALRQALTKADGLLFRVSTPSERQLLAPVDPAQRDLSPKLARQVESLRSGVRHLSEQVNTLLAKLHQASADNTTLRDLRLAGERFVTELRTLHEAETDLVLETAMRDTGAGD